MSPALYSRILLRYVAGYLVIKSVLPQDIADMIANDPELSALIGAAIAGAVEGAYAMAKRWGWKT